MVGARASGPKACRAVRGEAVQHRRRLHRCAGARRLCRRNPEWPSKEREHDHDDDLARLPLHHDVDGRALERESAGGERHARGNAAGHFTQQLQQQGWSLSSPVNATATASSTAVYYAPGQQAAAALVASELGVPASAVQPLSATVPVPTTTGLDVVVVIGPDLAGQGFPATTVTS